MDLTNEQRTAQTRQRIIGSTIRLFNARGVQVTADEIAAGAGVGKGSVFNHFHGKDQLLYEVFCICHNHAIEVTESGVDWEADMESVVRQLLRNSARWASEYPDEILYTFHYNTMKKNDLLDVELSKRIKPFFGNERIASRLRHMVRDEIPWEYFNSTVSNQNYQLGLYLAEHPEYRTDEVFIGSVIEWIWSGIAGTLKRK